MKSLSPELPWLVLVNMLRSLLTTMVSSLNHPMANPSYYRRPAVSYHADVGVELVWRDKLLEDIADARVL
jgi:hypothetical protein